MRLAGETVIAVVSNPLAEMRISEQNARLESEAMIRNLFIGGAVMAIALAFLAMASYRRKLKDNKKNNQQNKSIMINITFAIINPENKKNIIKSISKSNHNFLTVYINYTIKINMIEK